jgi:DNA repair protein RadA/Sms
MLELTAKYGIFYFANFVNSDMKPEDTYSMCCRLRLNKKELKRKGGGLFGADALTGSTGVVTLNLPRIGYLSKSEEEFFEHLTKLMDIAKKNNISIFIVGHVTKEGTIAGPRVLEHLVDTVIYFEGDRGVNFRILRSVKNRFGSTNEVGIFEMSESGLKEIRNLSEFLIGNRVSGEPGSATFVAVEGTRPIIVEIQALVSNSNLAMPRRISMGIENQRLNILVAVLEKKLGLPLYSNDIFLNVAGGIKLTETAVDLAACMAIVSSYRNLVLPNDMVFLGEVGLLGELRPIGQVDLRLKEAKSINFKKAILPANQRCTEDFDIIYAATLEEAMVICFIK